MTSIRHILAQVHTRTKVNDVPHCFGQVFLAMQEHPDTVGGAMLSGVREAVRAMRMLKGASEEEANAAAGAVDGGLPSRKRKQVLKVTPFFLLHQHKGIKAHAHAEGHL